MDTKLLKSIYYDVKNPGSYSGLSAFYRTIKEKKLPYKLSQVKKWLQEQEDYTLHKPLRKNFKRNRVVAYGIDHTWQADLVDVGSLSKFNNDYKFLLTVIDVFSKYAWILPLKNKSAQSILDAFKVIFEERKPKKIQTDKGKEFLNKIFTDYLNKNDVTLYQLNSEMKACVVERFNRTIKEKMWRYFTKNKTHQYFDILQDLNKSYNRSYHRSIKMKPIDVNTKNKDTVWENLYGKLDVENNVLLNFKFSVGDKVRIVKYKTIFAKGYTPNWSKEIFIVTKRLERNPPVYELKDLNDEIIEGVFYEQELQKIYKFNEIYEIDEILKTRTKKGEKEYFVSWKGYPNTFNSWIKSADILK